jgi:3'(2'), 5'-bisphosphate nucleotidase
MSAMRSGADLVSGLLALAEEAGASTMAVYGSDFCASNKVDRSPVTEADLRSDAIIGAGLARLFPGIPVVSEECLRQHPPQPDQAYFLVDPLDGTKEFIARTGEFTVNIALVQHGVAIAGVVFAPARGQMYHAARGEGAFRTQHGVTQRIRVKPYAAGERLRVVGSRSHGGPRLADWVAGLRVPQDFTPAGSSLKFCRVAEGEAHLYPRLGRTCQWDTAAAQCVLEESGGSVTDLRGESLRYFPTDGWFNPEFIAWGGEECLALCRTLRE